MDSETSQPSLAKRIRELLQVAPAAGPGLAELLARCDPHDLAESLYGFSHAELEQAIAAMPIQIAAEVFSHLDPPVLEAILPGLATEFLGDLAALMEPDDAADLVGMLEQGQAGRLLQLLPADQRHKVATLLAYDDDTAGGLMDPDAVRVEEHKTVREAVEEIRRYVQMVHLDDFFSIFVVGTDNRLVGSVPNWKMLLAQPEQRISEIMESQVFSVEAHLDQEEISHLFRDHDLVVAPVVDGENRLIGRITVDDIVDVIEEEHQEDLGRLAGTGAEDVRELSVFQTIRARAPFLLVALVGEFILAIFMRERRGLLVAIPALAFFIPLIMAMGGNTGMQSASLVIRGLATGEVQLSHFWRRFFRELLVSLGIGVMFAAIVVACGALITGRLNLGLAVGLATMVVILLATTLGTVIPMVLKRLNIDPALATGPFITTMNDVLGIVVYLGIAMLVMG